jgi:ABC-type lipoprotein release transport system permease subunit
MLILKIAWRNILRHKVKSLVIGIIIFLGALLMTIGNASVIGAQKGFDENFVNKYTGQLLLVSKAEKKDDILYPMMGDSLAIIQDYPALKSLLEMQDYIKGFIPLARGYAMLLGLEDVNWGLYALGSNFEDYQKTFQDNVELVEGKFLKNGQHGILISKGTREIIYKFTGHWVVPEGMELDEENLTEDARKEKQAGTLHVDHELVFMGWGESTLNTDIRLSIVGITKFKVLDYAMHEMCFMDIESFRECFGYFTAESTLEDLTPQEKSALAMTSDEDVFGGEDIYAKAVTTKESYDLKTIQAQTKRGESTLQLDSGAYNYVSVVLKPGVSIAQGTKLLNQAITESGVDARIINWKDASGQVAQMAAIMQFIVSFFVWILFFVAAVIIANTLSMAAIERTEELGMMRAIGALKGYFISHMFILETFLLSLVFSAIGIIAGMGCVFLLQLFNIQAGSSEILVILFGGDAFKPEMDFSGLVFGIIQLVILTSLAMIFPVNVATRIKPLDAINRN